MDDKGRVIIPLKFRSDLGQRFIVTKGFDRCLFVLSEDDFRVNFDEKFEMQNVLDPNTRRLQHHFCAEALEATVDPQGRVAIPSNLRKYADIKANDVAMIVGMTTRLEIWNREHWTSMIEAVSMDDLLTAANAIGIGSPQVPNPSNP